VIRAPIQADAPEAEAYRALRTTLSFSRLPEKRRTVLFTSARRGEGKSMTAINFAAVCAYGERPTLLVDADLRRPQIQRVLGVAGAGGGLSTFLQHGRNGGLAALAESSGLPFLDVVTAGPVVSNPAELLSRPSFGDLIDEARGAYDWVIVDAPPVLPIADAVIVSRVVDGVILLVDLRATPLSAARKARDLLRAVGAPVLGVVANNAIKTSTYGYGGYSR